MRDASGPVVLQVLPALSSGGVERGTVDIAAAIAAAGGTALVASAGGRLVTEIERAGGEHIRLPLDAKTPWALWRNAARLEALIRARGVQIVHARSRAPAWSALLAARRTGAHFVTTYHGVYGENLPFKRRYSSVMAMGERVIVASRFVADLVADRHAVPGDRLRVIPRGVDPAAFDPAAVTPARIARQAAAWQVPEGSPAIMLPGRLTSWKGHAVLIAALARLQRTDCVAVLVGAEQRRHGYVAELRRLADRLGVAHRLRLPGDCDDMPAAMLLADVVVSASTDPEAFGRVVIEAQAMARPVIVTDHGGAIETVLQNETGWRVRPGDPEALALAIDAALSLSPERRRALGATARRSVQKGFTRAAMQAATLRVYGELLPGCAGSDLQPG